MRRRAAGWQKTCHSKVSARRIAKVNSGPPTISHYRVVGIRRPASHKSSLHPRPSNGGWMRSVSGLRSRPASACPLFRVHPRPASGGRQPAVSEPSGVGVSC
jgi:hypothetical protein